MSVHKSEFETYVRKQKSEFETYVRKQKAERDHYMAKFEAYVREELDNHCRTARLRKVVMAAQCFWGDDGMFVAHSCNTDNLGRIRDALDALQPGDLGGDE